MFAELGTFRWPRDHSHIRRQPEKACIAATLKTRRLSSCPLCALRLLTIKSIFPQIFILFVSVTVAAVNAQWFGQMTSEIMADMHLIEQSCGLGQDIGQSSNREAYAKLCETDIKYRHLSSRLWLYRLLSSLCNLCCIACNFCSLSYMAENLVTL